MSLLDLTLTQIMYGVGATILILGGVNLILYLISSIINWIWWKKENRKDFNDMRYFFNHREEIKKYIREKL